MKQRTLRRDQKKKMANREDLFSYHLNMLTGYVQFDILILHTIVGLLSEQKPPYINAVCLLQDMSRSPDEEAYWGFRFEIKEGYDCDLLLTDFKHFSHKLLGLSEKIIRFSTQKVTLDKIIVYEIWFYIENEIENKKKEIHHLLQKLNCNDDNDEVILNDIVNILQSFPNPDFIKNISLQKRKINKWAFTYTITRENDTVLNRMWFTLSFIEILQKTAKTKHLLTIFENRNNETLYESWFLCLL